MVNPLDIGNRPPPYLPMGSSTTTTATLMGMSCGPASAAAAAVFLDRYARCMSEWLSTKLLMLTSTVRLLLKKTIIESPRGAAVADSLENSMPLFYPQIIFRSRHRADGEAQIRHFHITVIFNRKGQMLKQSGGTHLSQFGCFEHYILCASL